jgi:hypothetical protein
MNQVVADRQKIRQQAGPNVQINTTVTNNQIQITGTSVRPDAVATKPNTPTSVQSQKSTATVTPESSGTIGSSPSTSTVSNNQNVFTSIGNEVFNSLNTLTFGELRNYVNIYERNPNSVEQYLKAGELFLSFIPAGRAEKALAEGVEWAYSGLKNIINKFDSKVIGSAIDNVYTSTRPVSDVFPELNNVNPHYVQGAGPGVNANCVSCANATTARLLGDDTTAVATSSSGYGVANDLLYSSPFGTVDNLSVSEAQKRIAEAGDGAIGILIIQQPGSVQHVINFVNRNGDTYFIDLQIGQIFELNPNLIVNVGIR